MTWFSFATAAQGVENLFSGSKQSSLLDNANESARAAALGSALVGMEDDAEALFTNPAGLASLQRGQLSINSHFWLVDTFQETCLIGIPGPLTAGGFALAGSYLNYGTFEGRDELGSLASQYNADRLILMGGWGMEVVPDISLGVGLQGSQTRLAGSTYYSLASDFGLLAKLTDRLCLGAAYDNLGWVSQLGTMTSAINIGGTYVIPLNPTSHLLAAVSGVIQPGSVNYFQGGVEYSFHNRLFLRGGCQQPFNDNKITGLSALTAGVGLALSDLTFDYAYQPYGDLGNAHRVSIGYRFETSDLVLDPSTRKIIPQDTGKALPKPLDEKEPENKEKMVVEFDLPPDSINQGMELESQGKYREAAQFYQESIKKNRQDASAWWALGDLYRRFNLSQYAIRCFGQVIKLQPDNKKMTHWLEKYKAENP